MDEYNKGRQLSLIVFLNGNLKLLTPEEKKRLARKRLVRRAQRKRKPTVYVETKVPFFF